MKFIIEMEPKQTNKQTKPNKKDIKNEKYDSIGRK